ncbi:MAG TPA: hypothetical protein VIJ82_17815 [Streptosporangiaceae bacterium]|jgi:hypothetical protein
MFVAQGAPHVQESIRAAVVLFAVVSVVFWKMLLKTVVMVVSVTVIVLLAYGAIALLQSLHRL